MKTATSYMTSQQLIERGYIWQDGIDYALCRECAMGPPQNRKLRRVWVRGYEYAMRVIRNEPYLRQGGETR